MPMDSRGKMYDFLAKAPTGKEDTNTDFPSKQAINYQLLLRTLGDKDGLAIKYYDKKATKISELMWSYQRKSRAEAENVLKTTDSNSEQFVGEGEG